MPLSYLERRPEDVLTRGVIFSYQPNQPNLPIQALYVSPAFADPLGIIGDLNLSQKVVTVPLSPGKRDGIEPVLIFHADVRIFQPV